MTDPHVTPERAAETCALSRREDGLHSWAFCGDDPYIYCAFCDEMRDTLDGRVIRAGRS